MGVASLTLLTAAAAASMTAIKQTPQTVDAIIKGVTDQNSSITTKGESKTSTDVLEVGNKAAKEIQQANQSVETTATETKEVAKDAVDKEAQKRQADLQEQAQEDYQNILEKQGKNQNAEKAKQTLLDFYKDQGLDVSEGTDLRKIIDTLSPGVVMKKAANVVISGNTGISSDGEQGAPEDNISSYLENDNGEFAGMNTNPSAWAAEKSAQSALNSTIGRTNSGYHPSTGAYYYYDPLWGPNASLDAVDGLAEYTDRDTGQTAYRRVVRQRIVNHGDTAVYNDKNNTWNYTLYNLDIIT